MGILERVSREFPHIEGVLAVNPASSLYLCKWGQKTAPKKPSHSMCRKFPRQIFPELKSTGAEKSRCRKFPVLKSLSAEKYRCRKVPATKSPRVKTCTCRNVAGRPRCRNSSVPKCFGAETSPCRNVPVPKRPHAETFLCRNVHLPKRLQRRTAHVPECSHDEISAPK